ncbi:unnamed protein product [Taenia asiatica]|uniref:DEP domain-containing protein n=1 Tax=Taenia asiatica TaxID=60517 RepID=A0A158R7S0_TAEAS|nr:unnamed protein product [Taenia asiatica]
MVSIDFSGVDWYVVLAVSLGKASIFFLTMVIVLFVSRGKSIGLAGLLAIFTSQSNDVALAYPVLRLLYPDLAAYIYLFAPAQLVILNPLGYFALEWHKARERAAVDSVIALRSSTSSQTTFALACKRMLSVMRRVMLNPLFFMTLIGVIFNFILKHKLPGILEGFFKDLGASFSATALFYLGFSMVGRIKRIGRRGIYILILILVGKVLTFGLVPSIISPYITRGMTALLLSHQPEELSVPKSSFAFLYAAAPTAPPVFLFASNFGILPEVIGAGLVIGTFLYAPIMFIFAGMATLVHVHPQHYDETLERTAVYLSWASLLCCDKFSPLNVISLSIRKRDIVRATVSKELEEVVEVTPESGALTTADGLGKLVAWTLAILAVTKKAIRMPYRFLVCIIVSVVVFCSSLAIGSLWESPVWVADAEARTTLGQYISFFLFFFACTGSRVWTAFLCIALFFQVRRRRPLSNRVQVAFYTLGFVIPAVLTPILTFTAQPVTFRDMNPAFHYGKAQQICSVVLLVICLLTSLLTFLCIFRSKSVALHRNLTSERSQSLPNFADAADVIETNREVEYTPLLSPETGDQPGLSHSDGPVSPTSSDWFHSPPRDGVSRQHENEVAVSQEIRTTTSFVERSERQSSSAASENKSDDEEVFREDDPSSRLLSQSNVPSLHRFLILILLLMVSMFFGICICLWRLVRETEAGVFVVVEFIDQIFNFGQGILIFAVFGIDTELIINPLASCISTMRYWVMSNLSSRSLRLARQVKEEDVEQFVTTHLSVCMKQICTSLRWVAEFSVTRFDAQSFRRSQVFPHLHNTLEMLGATMALTMGSS